MFFNKGEISRKLSDLPLVQRCVTCGIEPNPLPTEGKGKRGILIVFDSPNEIQWDGRSWFADTSHPVFQAITYQGGNPVEDTCTTGVLLCRGTRADDKYEHCLASLAVTIKNFNPVLIITVGAMATGAVLRLYNPQHYKEGTQVADLFGYCVPLNQAKDWNCWLAPVMDAGRLNRGTSEMNEVSNNWLFKHVIWAYTLGTKRPPVYNKPEIEIVYDADQSIAAIDQAIHSELTAFDYETSTLEPWREKAEILTCAVSMGTRKYLQRTVSFMMTSERVRQKWVEYLRSPVAKIGANIMYEHYWSTVFLGTPTVNWVWDTCLGSRIMDCSPGVSNLKRTAFVYLGIIGYDDTVDAFMVNNPDGTNDLMKMNPHDLLTYNAYDAAYTYECALRQRELLNVSF